MIKLLKNKTQSYLCICDWNSKLGLGNLVHSLSHNCMLKFCKVIQQMHYNIHLAQLKGGCTLFCRGRIVALGKEIIIMKENMERERVFFPFGLIFLCFRMTEGNFVHTTEHMGHI